ncbi:MAG: hypothetical protein ACREAK_12115 [Nitrosarchaeum sp.]
MNEDIHIPQEFIDENKKNLCQFMPKSRRRGPHSAAEKNSRRNEVYRLHFEYGYSARKIAELMKINRNTANSDLAYWYSEIVGSHNIIDPTTIIVITLERLNAQYTRLREQCDKADSQQEKNSIERLMLDVSSKIIHTNIRMTESTIKVMDDATEQFNDWMKNDRSKTRYMTLFDLIRVSAKAREKIKMIISEDQKKGDYY